MAVTGLPVCRKIKENARPNRIETITGRFGVGKVQRHRRDARVGQDRLHQFGLLGMIKTVIVGPADTQHRPCNENDIHRVTWIAPVGDDDRGVIRPQFGKPWHRATRYHQHTQLPRPSFVVASFFRSFD